MKNYPNKIHKKVTLGIWTKVRV